MKGVRAEDLFRISTKADQGRIIAYIQLSITLEHGSISDIYDLSINGHRDKIDDQPMKV
jgi:hypothetical protein